MFTANDAVSAAIQLTFTFETGFTSLQFLGMFADALHVGGIFNSMREVQILIEEWRQHYNAK